MDDNTAIDAIEEVILDAVYNEENTILSNYNIAKAVFEAGYRLDPYPNGKSKDELIKRIEELEAERDRARNLLRGLHDSTLKADPWLRGKHDMVGCPVCTFLDETNTVIP